MSHDDFDFEPVRGLPAALPPGERLLWQGTPRWRSLAIRSYHVRKVAVYFAVLVLWRIGYGVSEGHAPSAIALSCLFLVGLGAAAAGVLSLLAYFTARSTVYSLTNRRVLLRHGVAVPLTMNLPLTKIDNAALRSFADGTGDISFQLPRNERIGYLISWPHLRPDRIARPEPSFRALGDAERAAELLAGALREAADEPAVRDPRAPAVPPATAPTPAGAPAFRPQAAGNRSPAAA